MPLDPSIDLKLNSLANSIEVSIFYSLEDLPSWFLRIVGDMHPLKIEFVYELIERKVHFDDLSKDKFVEDQIVHQIQNEHLV